MRKIYGPTFLSEIDLPATLEALPVGAVLVDMRGCIRYYNHFQEKLDGLNRQDVLGRHVNDIYSQVPGLKPTHLPENCPSLTVIRSREPIFDLFEIYICRSGRIINSTHTVLPLFKHGDMHGCLCLVEGRLREKPERRRPGVSARDERLFSSFVGQSPEFRAAVDMALAEADTPSSILICGETGTGKGLLAGQLHAHSQRAGRPLVVVNLAAVPSGLLEGQLFGSIKGAFTGAVDRPGLFEEADGGTIYLDEVDSLPLELQPKLLRAIQERKIRRVGAIKETSVDLKIISSFSKADPLAAVASGAVRSDLFYRLGVVIINIPPLRNRLGDLPGLASFFINKHQSILGKKISGLAPEVLDIFRRYNWPGNVRELENIIEGTLNMAHSGEFITLRHLPPFFRHLMLHPAGQAAGLSLDERQSLIEALRQHRGNLKRASEQLGLSRQLLAYRLKKYDLDRRSFKADKI